MVSAIDLAKRALVKRLKRLALVYKVVLTLDRLSTDAQVRTAYRKVSTKTHPDHGGDTEHQKEVNAAHDAWQDALKGGRGKRDGVSEKWRQNSASACVKILEF
jgi:DnaJ-class molecular chaperone